MPPTTLTPKQAAFVAEYETSGCVDTAAALSGYALSARFAGYYVYLLVDPRDGRVFYVGKGKGRRAHTHESRVRGTGGVVSAKDAAISGILRDGRCVRVECFADALSESQAFAVERSLIAQLRGSLTNTAGGVVSAEDSARAAAMENLRRIKPFDVWVRTCQADRLESVKRAFGLSPREFYDWFVARYRDLATGQIPLRSIAIRTGPV